MSENDTDNPFLVERLKRVLKKIRPHAERGGTMHPAWDTIGEAENVLKGRPPFVTEMTRNDAMICCLDNLSYYEGIEAGKQMAKTASDDE